MIDIQTKKKVKNLVTFKNNIIIQYIDKTIETYFSCDNIERNVFNHNVDVIKSGYDFCLILSKFKVYSIG